MALTRLDNLYSSKTGKYLYVSPDDFNATDELDNRGNSPLRPFKTIQRAFIEVSRFSYVPGSGNDRFDQFSIMLMPGNHYIDNRPGLVTVGAGSSTGQSDRFFDASELITQNKTFIAKEAVDRMLNNNSGFNIPGGTQNCVDDVEDIIDAVVYNLKYGGNDRVYDAANLYVTGAHVQGEEDETVEVFEAARDIAIQVMKNETVTVSGSHGLSQITDSTIPTDGNTPYCNNVASAITVLFSTLIQAVGTDASPNGNLTGITRTAAPNTDELPVFGFNQSDNEWNDKSILDLSDPNNALYKFNATTGGAIVPRGCSLIGYDLRRTIIRPLYVPDPVDGEVGRTSIFNLTGGCYLWQFTIKDGDLSSNSPLFDSTTNVGKVYTQPIDTASSKKTPEFSHHKICIMEYADNNELDLYYKKIGSAFQEYQPTIDDDGELDNLVQENRIVGPLSDSRSIQSIKVTDNAGASTSVVTVTTKIDHGYFDGQYVAVLNTGLDEELNGSQKIYISTTDSRVFTYTFGNNAASIGLVSDQLYTQPTLGSGAIALAEIDSVESASPYVFNCSIRSTWGQCGMWANGSKATGFRSMVVAQYTGVSLQKDDRAFIRYDRFTNTWNQASLTDAFATVPYHTKGDAYWKDDWKNFHIRASDDSFIQCVSVFAVGFFDHFLMESGGDMSITNSNSNFGNTSLHAIGHKGYAFNQDKGGYITDIIPPKLLDTSVTEKVQYYSLDILNSNDQDNHTKIYLGSEAALDPNNIPATTISGFRIGSRSNEKIYVKLGGNNQYRSELSPSGFKKYSAALSFFSPASLSNVLDSRAQDAANRIIDNKQFIMNEAYGYITDKYPTLLSKEGITIEKCKRDIGYILDAVVSDLRLTLNASNISATYAQGDYSDTSNINVIQAAESYYVGASLDYIDNELTETIETYRYVEELVIAAMRNWDYTINGCIVVSGNRTITVGDTTGLVNGMVITGTGVPTNTEITDIPNATQITISADPTAGGTVNLTFDLVEGNYDTTVAPVSDDTITNDPSSSTPECANIANLLRSYFDNIVTIFNNGSAGITRRETKVNIAALSQRATAFTVNTGGGTSNPHKFETGTAVRLVPRAKAGTNPDKRLIRLPSGFSPNRKYYVIAPGRFTQPYDYSSTSSFAKTATTKLLLATSKENAYAGNYIYSPETETIDSDVEIDIYQFVLDDKYDLHKYQCEATGDGGPEILQTNVSHHFHDPATDDVVQKVFFRGDTLPTISGGSPINGSTEFYARYVKTTTVGEKQNKFTIHNSATDARNGVGAISFQSNTGSNFFVYSNKNESSVRFNPSIGTTGNWYLNVVDESSGSTPNTNSILYRLHQSDFNDASGQQITSDSWYNRITDARGKEDRVYRLRYVIPKYLQSVRDPLNGFVIKMRTDEKRNLVAQKLLLKAIGGAPTTPTDLLSNIGTSSSNYDPYENPIVLNTTALSTFESNQDNKFSFTIQSGKVVDNDLELTVFDHDTNNEALRGKTFTVVKVTAPQGGEKFSVDSITDTATISWTGYCSGNAYLHNVVSNPIDTNTTDYYLVLRDVTGKLDYSQFTNTRFQQGTMFADLLQKPDSVGDADGDSKSSRDDYLYSTKRAALYTAVPGDTIEIGTGQYRIFSVTDVPEIEDTFYIFDVDTIQDRIYNQQDGIYYLTCVRGNISPFPQGPGIGNNFKNFKFPQPISQLYPLNYKNDPLWFQKIDPNLIDPPATVSAADNYIHGLVTVNDSKGSETRESTLDLLANLNQDANYTESGVEFGLVKATTGNATSGSEDRKIRISGNEVSEDAQKLYVELRRPSIARSGNHTFEYLGFGPGNYSTGFPLRQEVVLQDVQDFYAQAKRENGGIVFYTGLNSNGDLYIGNRKINAITGEETFLESAELVDSEDDGDDLGTLVTTFETAVRFEDKITVEGKSFFNNEVEINVQPELGESLRIFSNIPDNEDLTLDRESFPLPDSGDIVLTKNKVNSAIFEFNPRGNTALPGQAYSFRTHVASGQPSNVFPNQSGEFDSERIVTYGGQPPTSGDILFKGLQTGTSGSLGWIYSNGYVGASNSVFNVTVYAASNIVKIGWVSGSSNASLKLSVGDTVRLSNFTGEYAKLNGIFKINGSHPTDVSYGSNFATKGYVYIDINENFNTGKIVAWNDFAGRGLDISSNKWKEIGVIGSESIRTFTDTIGNYMVGINTVARSISTDYTTSFVTGETTPRANLDVVGTAFISGKSIDFLTRDETDEDNAFLVGGVSSSPNSGATLRVATSNGGRVGINTVADNTNANNLDRNLVVIGNSRFTDDARFEHDIEINGDDGTVAEIRTSQTSGTFNLVTDSTFTGTLNLAGDVEFINVGNVRTLTQTINIGDNVIGDQFINIGNSCEYSNIDLGATPDNRLSDGAGTISKIQIGGAYDSSESLSFTRVKTKSFKVDGDFQLGSRRTINDTVTLSTTAGQVDFFSNSGSASIINFGLNASEINIAGQGGVTTVNNQLEVIASATFQGNITMCGGVASFSFVGNRGQLGSPEFAHADGILSDTLFNKNIDIINVLVVGTTDEGYNQVDTAGAGLWGGAAYQQEVTNIGGSPVVEPQSFPLLTGDEFYLPIKNQPIKNNGDPYFVENDYIIINSAITASGHPEIVQVLELTRTAVAPYYLKVKRQPLGTYTAILTNHTDTTPIYKVNVQFDATWTELPLDATGPQDNVYLAEFGGSLTNNDYVIVDREDTNSDGIFNQGEVIKVVTPLVAEEQKFRISSDCSNGTDSDVFVVNSVTGDTTILGNTTINNSLKIKGGCGTISKIAFSAASFSGSFVLTGVNVTSPDKTLSDIQVGDYIAIITNEASLDILPDTKIVAINPASNEIVVDQNIVGFSSGSFTFEARRNEKFTLTNGEEVPVFTVDTCTGTTQIGNHFGRIDIEYATAGNTSSTTANIPTLFDNGTIKKAYGFWYDPQTINAGGPSTTVRDTAAGSSGLVQVPVQDLGTGTGAFAIDDLVFIGTTTAGSTGIGDFQICKITDVVNDAANPTIVVGPVGDGLDTNQPITPADNIFDVGNVVRRVLKHPELANIVDCQTRQRVVTGATSDYCSIILDRGYIVQQKLDYLGWIALADAEGDAMVWAAVKGRMKGVVHTTVMNEQIKDGAIEYRSGDLTVASDIKMIGGSFEIYDSVNKTRLLGLVNDDGHADHQGLFFWDAGVVARGDFYLFSAQDPENVIQNPDSTVPSFFVDNLGNVGAELTFTVEGVAQTTPSSTVEQLSIKNLGPSGGKKFAVKQDNSIDSFGYTNFYTSSGGRHTRYISSASTEEQLNLKPNITYMVNTVATSTLVVKLPTSPQTGDIVRLIDVSGNLNYNTSLVVRTEESSNVPIQGDSTGTLLGGRITPYPSGELVVQTANAAFSLIYLGATDSDGQVGIPTSVQGWWLMEV